ncbi:MAG: porin family protein [Sulfurimonas sp.]|nr:porin family protein [Sulfurimonas sp.]
MKKNLYALLITFVMFSNVNASEYDVFVGADLGVSYTEFTDEDGTYENNNISTYGIKAGIINDSSRVYLTYHYLNAFENSSNRNGKFQTIAINADGFSNSFNTFDKISHVFFIGGHLGSINAKVNSNFGSSNTYGLIYGVQGGMLTSVTSFLDIELGYRASFSNFFDKDNDLNRIDAFYAGVNFRF